MQKEPTAKALIAASVPPATTTSARPARIMSRAWPMASEPEAQAVTAVWTGPLMPKWMAMLPAASLPIIIGTVSGSIRDGPDSSSLAWLCSKISMPPMPLPSMTAVRSRSTAAPSSPASFQAWTAAATANWVNSAILRASFLSM